MTSAGSFRDRLAAGPAVLLDGPTGTELQRRGVDTNVPQWSAVALETAPRTVLEIHQDYVAAGAEVLTANTFRTHRLNLEAVGWSERTDELTYRAVELAREAALAAERPIWIAGSQAPIADCYTPLATPTAAVLEREHGRMSEQLAAAGVDLILVETHPTLREALAASRAALATGLPVVASLVCSRFGKLLSGESLAEAARALSQLPIEMLCVNCILAESVQGALETLRQAAPRLPIGAYANIGYLNETGDWVQADSRDPRVYGELARGWLETGARMIGSCCGTTPEHIRRLRALLDAT